MSWRVIEGDCRQVLATLPERSIHTCITSPPYFGLRDYGHEGQIGLEPTPDEFVSALVEVFREVRRVLRDDGTVFLNLGDTMRDGSLLGMPWQVAAALRGDGWLIRNAIVWAKPDAQPESAADRLTQSYEHVFLLSKTRSYYFNWQALAVPFRGTDTQRRRHEEARTPESHVRSDATEHKSGNLAKNSAKLYAAGVARPRDIWDVPLREPDSDRWRGHTAMMPMRLVYKCVVAGSRIGDCVLDPFTGAGTTGLVALRQGRSFIGIELNPTYARMARERILDDAPLLNQMSEAA